MNKLVKLLLACSFAAPAFAQTSGLPAPSLTGISALPNGVTATTQTAGDSTAKVATNAFVSAAVAATASGAGIVTYSGPSLTLSGTLYFPIGGGGLTSSTETNVDLDSPAAATIQNFSVQMSAAPGVGNSVVYTWRKNASDTTLTCTISGASATSCSDTTHSFTVAAADLLAIKAVTTGTIVGTPTVVMGTQFGIASGSGGTTNITSLVTPTGCTISGNVCTVGSAVNSVTFASIPGTYRNLKVTEDARVSDSADHESIVMQLNGDTSTSTYFGEQFFGGNATAVAAPLSGTAGETLCVAAGSTAPANHTSGCQIWIFNYAGTTFAKSFWGASSSFGATGSTTNWYNFDLKGWWNATPAAVTSVKLIDSGGGNFVVGTSFTLVGEP